MENDVKSVENRHAIGILLRGPEVARILNVSKAFAYRLMAQGEIPTIRLGRAVRVRPEDLDQFLVHSVQGKDASWLSAVRSKSLPAA